MLFYRLFFFFEQGWNRLKSQHIVILVDFNVLNWYFCRKITMYCEYERDRKDY